MWRNTDSTYGMIAIILHWLVAIMVFILFVLGLWMVDLNYYDSWYRRAPEIHKSSGVLLFFIILFRLIWNMLNKKPQPLPGNNPLEEKIATVVHFVLNILLFAVMLSGYLISTADGRPIEVFGMVNVPATLTGLEKQEDIAGIIHLVLAIILISLSGFHAMAALKHHFINRDKTLIRMLRF
jgi:cytochrome b561